MSGIRLIISLVVMVVLLWLFSLLWQHQRADAAETTEPTLYSRYQYFPGIIPEVFDTHTGRVYVWMPRDEKKNRNPYLIVRDVIERTYTEFEIKFIGR